MLCAMLTNPLGIMYLVVSTASWCPDPEILSTKYTRTLQIPPIWMLKGFSALKRLGTTAARHVWRKRLASLDFHGEELTSHDRRPNQPFSSPFASEP